ncbi:MAG: polysaccharide deacetylase family protein [Bradymonadaceae bacterium]|nr:polysaccharide deacetylase family protein [Lujinxingiaceae bacterium]
MGDSHHQPLKMGQACVSVDLDGLRCYRDIHGLSAPRAQLNGGQGADAAYSIGVRRLLDFFDAERLPATLFVIGRDLEVDAHSSLLLEAHEAGHELANHSYSHHYDLRTRPLAEQEREIARCEEAILELTGRKPTGFRTPGYNVDASLLAICRSRGYLYDSSIFACPPYYLAKGAVMSWLSLRGRPSRSQMTRPQTLLAPLAPYFPDEKRFWRDSQRGYGLLEMPMAVVPGVRFPIIGTSLHLLKELGFDAVYPLIRRAQPRHFNLEFHAIDFMDSNDEGVADLVGIQPDLAVPWTTKRARYAHVFARLREHYRFATLEDTARSF